MWRFWLRQTIPEQQILESINKTILINTENLQTAPRKHRIFAEKPARKTNFNIKLYPPAHADTASNLKCILCETGASTAKHSKNLRQEVQIIYLNKASRRITDLCWCWSKMEPDQDAGVSSITTHNRFWKTTGCFYRWKQIKMLALCFCQKTLFHQRSVLELSIERLRKRCRVFQSRLLLFMQAPKRHNELNFREESTVFNVTQPLFIKELQNT